MVDVKFTDNSIAVKNLIHEKAAAFLYEAAAEIESQAKRNSRVDTGETKGSWSSEVDEEKLEAFVGNTKENAIWEEFGTGEYAVNGDGRQTPWQYQDAKGNWHTTTGKTPNRALERAFESKKRQIQEMAQSKLGEVGDSD
ncbi:HK97 gp10 family phage protein [Oscillospiraceae bacterium LCP25S3_E4]